MVRPFDKHHLESGICSPHPQRVAGADRVPAARKNQDRRLDTGRKLILVQPWGHLAIRPPTAGGFHSLSPDAPGQRHLSRPRQGRILISPP